MRDRYLWLGCLVYAALFTWLGAIKYDAHRNFVDFGVFAQTAASAFGCFCNTIEGSHWAVHFSPILYLVGAALWIGRSPLTLVALQAVAGALTAPPIYALVRVRCERRVARLVALVVWLYPPLAGLIFGDFHENGFAPAAVAWTLYMFDAGRLAWTLVGALTTLSIKEDQAIFLLVAGALGWWRFHGTNRGRVAAAVSAIGALIAIVFFLYIRPHAASAVSAPWQPWRFYDWSPPSVTALPSEIGTRLGFLLLILAPLAFLPLRSSMMLLVVAPLAEVLLSRMPTTFTLGTHYAGAWIGYVLVAFAFAARELRPRRAAGTLFVCLSLCAVEFALADPLHPGLNLRRSQPRDAALDNLLQTLPRHAEVATQEEAYTHLALWDPYARLLPESPQQELNTCLVLIDRSFPNSPRLQEYGAQFGRLVQEHRYVVVKKSDGIELAQQRHGCR